MKNIYQKFIMIFFLAITLISCELNDNFNEQDFLITVSKNEAPEDLRTYLYFFKTKKKTSENTVFINNQYYKVLILHYSKDGFSLISCCNFNKVNNVISDYENILKEFSKPKIDSISKIYANKQKAIYNHLDKIIVKENDLRIKNKGLLFNFFKIKNLDYCLCQFTKVNDDFRFELGYEAFITEIEGVEFMKKKSISIIENNLNEILENKIVKSFIDQNFGNDIN